MTVVPRISTLGPEGGASGLAAGFEVTRMRNGLVRFALGGVLLVVAACGGGGSTGPTAAPATEAPAAEASAPADGGAGAGGQPTAQASVAAPASEAPAAGGGGGGAAVGVCELVTADELAGVFGEPVTMTVLPGPPDNCIVDSATGDALTAWSLTTAQASVVYDAFTTDPSTVDVSGVGDKAAIVQNTGLLVLKGSNLLVIMISGGSGMSEEEGIEASKQIGVLAAGRL
jgi:hypothetical protein